MIYDKTGTYGTEWAKGILARLGHQKGFRRPSKQEVERALKVLNNAPREDDSPKGLLRRLKAVARTK